MSVYEDNRFVGAKYVNCADFEVSDGRMIIESSIENVGEFDEVKFMLLGDFTTMKPLTKSFNCK
jgi:hypothetical protein